MKKTQDIGLKIGTEREAFWTKVKKMTEEDIKGAKNSIELNEEIIKIADEKIKKEKE